MLKLSQISPLFSSVYAGHPDPLFGSQISGRIRSQLMGKLAGGAEFQILLATDFCSQLDKSQAKAAGKGEKKKRNEKKKPTGKRSMKMQRRVCVKKANSEDKQYLIEISEIFRPGGGAIFYFRIKIGFTEMLIYPKIVAGEPNF